MEALATSPMVRAVDANGLSLLSKREMDVVRSLAEGLTNREIAERLGLSQHTIKNYLFRVYDKLGVSSRLELLFMTLTQASAKPSDGAGADQSAAKFGPSRVTNSRLRVLKVSNRTSEPTPHRGAKDANRRSQRKSGLGRSPRPPLSSAPIRSINSYPFEHAFAPPRRDACRTADARA